MKEEIDGVARAAKELGIREERLRILEEFGQLSREAKFPFDWALKVLKIINADEVLNRS